MFKWDKDNIVWYKIENRQYFIDHENNPEFEVKNLRTGHDLDYDLTYIFGEWKGMTFRIPDVILEAEFYSSDISFKVCEPIEGWRLCPCLSKSDFYKEPGEDYER